MVKERMKDILSFLAKCEKPIEYDKFRAEYSILSNFRFPYLTTNYFSPLVKAGFIDVWGVKNPRYNLNDVDSFEPISVRMCRLSDLGKLWLEKGEIRF